MVKKYSILSDFYTMPALHNHIIQYNLKQLLNNFMYIGRLLQLQNGIFFFSFLKSCPDTTNYFFVSLQGLKQLANLFFSKISTFTDRCLISQLLEQKSIGNLVQKKIFQFSPILQRIYIKLASLFFFRYYAFGGLLLKSHFFWTVVNQTEEARLPSHMRES